MDNLFDITITYSQGSEIVYMGNVWTFKPPERGYQWSVGSIPSNETYWYRKLHVCIAPESCIVEFESSFTVTPKGITSKT